MSNHRTNEKISEYVAKLRAVAEKPLPTLGDASIEFNLIISEPEQSAIFYAIGAVLAMFNSARIHTELDASNEFTRETLRQEQHYRPVIEALQIKCEKLKPKNIPT